MSQALRKLSGTISKSKTTAVFINQLREKIVSLFGSPETTSGGRALKFYALVRLDAADRVAEGRSEVVGNRPGPRWSRTSWPCPSARPLEFDVIYGQGISKEGSLLDVGVDVGLIKKSGAWFTYDGDQLGQGRENSRNLLRDNLGSPARSRRRSRPSSASASPPPPLPHPRRRRPQAQGRGQARAAGSPRSRRCLTGLPRPPSRASPVPTGPGTSGLSDPVAAHHRVGVPPSWGPEGRVMVAAAGRAGTRRGAAGEGPAGRRAGGVGGRRPRRRPPAVTTRARTRAELRKAAGGPRLRGRGGRRDARPAGTGRPGRRRGPGRDGRRGSRGTYSTPSRSPPSLRDRGVDPTVAERAADMAVPAEDRADRCRQVAEARPRPARRSPRPDPAPPPGRLPGPPRLPARLAESVAWEVVGFDSRPTPGPQRPPVTVTPSSSPTRRRIQPGRPTALARHWPVGQTISRVPDMDGVEPAVF